MSDKIKLRNPNKFNVGVKLIDPTREVNIKAGSFILVTENDVYHLDTVCTLLKRGMLVAENEEINTNLGFVEKNPNIIDDEEIKKLLSGNFMKMKSEITKYTEPHAIDAIYRIAKEIASGLSGGKLKFLSEFCGKQLYVEDIGNQDGELKVE